MSRFITIFNIRPGEERTSALLVSLMLFTAAGSALGGNATEALFFARFGTQQLPVMYILLGLFSFATSMAITALMGRIAKQRLYAALPLALGLILIGERLVIPLQYKWFFAVMWLGMNVINSLQGLLTWGLAGATYDTRQAKRLFPLFSAGSILGTVLGGLATQPLASWLHAENLLLLWAGALFVSFGLGRALAGRRAAAVPVSALAAQPGVIDEMQRGYRFVRRSPIMQWVSYSAILFSVCYFSLALPFSRGAAAQFPDADRLAGFLGQFQSLSTLAALLASLFLASRLFARFGIMPMLLIFPVIYLTGFAVLAIYAPFAVLVAIRFAQTSYMNGIANTSWQAMFNVVPAEQRDQVRAFVGGVPEQAGTFIAGLILFVGEQALQPQQLYLVGLLAAALLVFVVWRANRAYGQALVEALRAGQPQVFFSEAQPFGGPRSDAAAVAVVLDGLRNLDASVRRVSAEILGFLPVSEAAAHLVTAIDDDEPSVRAAAIKSLAQVRASTALLEISARLADPDAGVRCQAIDSLEQLAAPSRGIVAHVEPLLSDSDLLVRTRAALTLLRVERHAGAQAALHAMAADANPLVRAQAIDALGACKDGSALNLVISALEDVQPVVRMAASRAIVQINPSAALDHLLLHLNDEDSAVRRTLAESAAEIGEPAVEPLVKLLANPLYADGALMALEHLPVQKAEPGIREQAKSAALTALHYHRLALSLSQKFENDGPVDDRLHLLTDALQAMSRFSGLNALRALGLVTERETVSAAVDHLRSRSAAQRANALETLEAVGEREIVHPLLALWEARDEPVVALPEDWLINLLDDPSAWLRACAVLFAPQLHNPEINEKLKSLSSTDPDEMVRATAENALLGDLNMETLTTLSLMERILFLRRVPLFADLSPADLKQIAAIASEILVTDGQALARQGEWGAEMYILVSGEVRVLIATENQKEPREVARRRAGDYVGEMAILGQEPRMATLIADGAVRVLCLQQKQFEGMLRERPEISLAMMRILSQRLKEASSQTI